MVVRWCADADRHKVVNQTMVKFGDGQIVVKWWSDDGQIVVSYWSAT